MDKLVIIKIGGNIIDDEKRLAAFLRSFASINQRKILVHGGGKLATAFAEKLGIKQKILDGRRITDAETLKIVTMVYAGLINKNIVAALQAHNCNAMGLTGADGDSILAHKRKHAVLDYGFAGDIDSVNTNLVSTLLSQQISPVFAPITHDQKGQLLNTNADTIAQELARGLSNDFDVTLVYSFEKNGVLLDTNNEQSVIPEINNKYYQQLKNGGKIFAGMLPKLDNAFSAINNGVKKVIIGNAEELQDLLEGKKGTTIINE
jgi:acetylglutamate kinase